MALVLAAGAGAVAPHPSLPGGAPSTVAPPQAHLPAPPPEAAFAPIALLVDITSGRTLYAHNEDEHFPPASVTKTMTAYVAFDMLARGELKPDQQIPVGEAAWREWHAKGSRMFLAEHSSISVDNLLMGILNVSANDGCIVLAEGAAGSVPAWVERMNATARRLGMTGSHFGTPNGWMDKGQTYYTARDLVTLADAMITNYPQYYHRYVGHPEFTWNGITQHNHDPLLGVVQGADGIKTGFTGEAMYTYLGTAQRNGRRLVVVLAGVPNPHQREKAARALMEWGFSAWQDTPLVAPGRALAQAKVQGGTAASVPLVAPREWAVTLPRGDKANVAMRVVYQGPVMAPVAKGQPLATLEVSLDHGTPTHVPLVAGQDVPKGGVMDRLRAGFARFSL